ncbi:hypothetical protein HAX54_043742, partial [Datura stramonium]|nr:hypothetical protein [Datura stramonium]
PLSGRTTCREMWKEPPESYLPLRRMFWMWSLGHRINNFPTVNVEKLNPPSSPTPSLPISSGHNI